MALVGYICKYTPIEIIEAFGEMEQIEPKRKSQEWADRLAREYVQFMKGILEK